MLRAPSIQSSYHQPRKLRAKHPWPHQRRFPEPAYLSCTWHWISSIPWSKQPMCFTVHRDCEARLMPAPLSARQTGCLRVQTPQPGNPSMPCMHEPGWLPGCRFVPRPVCISASCFSHLGIHRRSSRGRPPLQTSGSARADRCPFYLGAFERVGLHHRCSGCSCTSLITPNLPATGRLNLSAVVQNPFIRRNDWMGPRSCCTESMRSALQPANYEPSPPS